MKGTLHAVEVVTPAQAAEWALPEEVQLSLAEIAGAAKEGLLALAVGTGLAVLHEAMAHEVTLLVGPKGRHDAERSAYRHGHTAGEVTLGGRRVPVERPRARGWTGRASSACAPTSTSRPRTRSRAWCWSACSPACRRAASRARRSRSASA